MNMKKTKPTFFSEIKALIVSIIIMFVSISIGILFCFILLTNKAVAVNIITKEQQIEQENLLNEWKECLIKNVEQEDPKQNPDDRIKNERINKIKKYDFIDFDFTERNEFKKNKKCSN